MGRFWGWLERIQFLHEKTLGIVGMALGIVGILFYLIGHQHARQFVCFPCFGLTCPPCIADPNYTTWGAPLESVGPILIIIGIGLLTVWALAGPENEKHSASS